MCSCEWPNFAVGIPVGKVISDMRVLRSLVVNKAAVGIPMGREISDLRVSQPLVNKDAIGTCSYTCIGRKRLVT